MKFLARAIFRSLAAAILKKERPVVVAVAGSVGKTGTKEAIAAALAHPGRPVRKTFGSFNAAIGVPVAIIAGGEARTKVWQWFGVMLSGLVQLIGRRPYPKALVLELGADKPGDLRPLVTLARPTIGVLTAVTPEHMEFFDTIEAVVAEESLVVRMLPADGTAVMNLDDQHSRELIQKLRCRVITFGWAPEADIRIDQVRAVTDEHGLPTGQIVKLAVAGSVIPIALPGVIGRHQAYPVAAAIAVANVCGDETLTSVQRLKAYQAPPGRMHLFCGVEGTVIIDDSYNASPASMISAVTTLLELDVPGKKHVILGQMSELGSTAAASHDRIGSILSPDAIETIITVGSLAKRIGEAAVSKHFPPARLFTVDSAEAAATTLRPLLKVGDAILVKGSHFPKPGYSGFIGQAVKILLADPRMDESKLVPRT